MRRFAVLSLLLAGIFAGPAQADSTVTQTVPPGGTMRSSADAAPTPENPVIATVTAAPSSESGCHTNCSMGDSQITIAIQAQHDNANGGSNEGPSGYEFLGPQVKITSSHPYSNIAEAVFEVDASLVLPGFLKKKIGGSPTPFSVRIAEPGRPLTGDGVDFGDFASIEELADGDYRLVVRGASGTTNASASTGTYDLVQQAFYANAAAESEDLPDALRNGVRVLLLTNYRADVQWKLTVSSTVARQLKLKSVVVGAKHFDKPGHGRKRIPLVSAARRALKRYSRVSMTASSIAKGPNGQVIRDKDTFTLERPASELG